MEGNDGSLASGRMASHRFHDEVLGDCLPSSSADPSTLERTVGSVVSLF